MTVLRDALDTVEQMDLFYSSVALNRVVVAARLYQELRPLIDDFLGSLTETEGCYPPPDYEFSEDACPELAALLAVLTPPETTE